MSPDLIEHAGSWLLTYLVHSTALYAAALLTSALLGSRNVALQEALWRGALLGAVCTSSLQLGAGWQPLLPTSFWGEAAVQPGLTPVASVDPIAPAPAITSAQQRGAHVQSWSAATVGGWIYLAVSTAGLLWLLAGNTRARRRLADRQPVRRGPVLHALTAVRRRAGARLAVRLTASPRIATPLAFGLTRPEICVPARFIDRLDGRHLRALLHHELAHLLRGDSGWRLAARAVERILWLQPLNVLARRRLDHLAELRCDDHAVRHTADGPALAACLVEVAAWQAEAGDRHAPQLTPAALDSRARLASRVRRALAPRAAESPRSRRRLAALALMAAAMGLPSISLGAPPPPEPRQTAESLDALAGRLRQLSETQLEISRTLAALLRDLEHEDRAALDRVLVLLQERAEALQRECAAVHEAISNPPPTSSPQ